MFCPNCGKQIRDNINFCEYCGTKINNSEDDMYKNSYYKSSYKKQGETKKDFALGSLGSMGESFFKGVLTMFFILIGLFGIMFAKSYLSNDIFSLDKAKYQQYVEDPSTIPELTEPETLSGLINNLKEVQSFLVLYLNYSDDEVETKLETFDKYRKELLKVQKFNNSNLLQENVQYQIPRDEKEFKKSMDTYARECAKYIYQDDEYEIMIPETVKDILEESERQHNCLDQFVMEILEADMIVLFMRDKSRRNKSLVTIEVGDKSIRQAKACCNKSPTIEQMKFIDKFAKAKGLFFRKSERAIQ